tara:strand:+ start:422 stop:652 length:231 start_codon:yes stop_codon:yes gene_type:complete
MEETENCPSKYWFTNLNDDDKKYITDHPNPSHMVVYLKKGLKFTDALRLGYEDAMREEVELLSNTTKDNVNTNLLL